MGKHFDGFSLPNHTQIPNDLLDWMLPDLSGAELKVLLYICRRTFGFHKEQDAISIDQLCNGLVSPEGRRDRGTGLSREGLIQTCEQLDSQGLLEIQKVERPGRGHCNTYRVRFTEDAKNEILQWKQNAERVNSVDSLVDKGSTTVDSLDTKKGSTPPPEKGQLFPEKGSTLTPFNKIKIQNKEEQKKDTPPTPSNPKTPDGKTADWFDVETDTEKPAEPHPRLDALEKPAKETEYAPYGRGKKSLQFGLSNSARLREMRERADFTTPSGNGFHPNGHAAGSPGEPAPVSVTEQQVVATWNRIVPASPAAYDARADRAAMVKLSSNALFLENIDPICRKAQKIHEADPEGSGWLKLWMLPQTSKNGQPHWRRLMNGDYDFMMNPERRTSGSSSGDDLAARVDAKFQKRAEESKKKAERKQK